MSYDFRLRFAGARRQRKGKLSPEQQERLSRSRERLLAFDPDVRIEPDASDRFTATSSLLGEVFVQPDRIELGMSLGAEPRKIYQAIHQLLRCFDGEGFDADDPQLGTSPVYHDDFATFMRQYRTHFACDDAEFAQWCRGETPPAWAERAAARERGSAIAAAVMPIGWERTWEQHKAMSDEEMWTHLLDVSRRNDEAIAEHELAEYLRALSYASEHSGYGHRRVDGSYYPSSGDASWFNHSMLKYESYTLGELRRRGYAPAVCSQPQRVLVVFATGTFTKSDWDVMAAMIRTIYAELQQAGLLARGLSGQGEQQEFRYEFIGADADAIHAALARAFEQPGLAQPLRFEKRFGGTGAREEIIPFSGVHALFGSEMR